MRLTKVAAVALAAALMLLLVAAPAPCRAQEDAAEESAAEESAAEESGAEESGAAQVTEASGADAGGDDGKVAVDPSLESSSASSSASDAAPSEENGAVTIVENANHLNALAQKKTYDEETEAKMAEEKLKYTQEQHTKKMAAYKREQMAEQNSKREEELKARTKRVEEANAKQRAKEADEKKSLEERTKKHKKEKEDELARQKQAHVQQQQKAAASAAKETDAKKAEHEKRKKALAEHHKKGNNDNGKEKEDSRMWGGRRLPLRDGWRDYGHSYQGARVHKNWRVCSMSGLINGASSLMAWLPGDCRPHQGRLIFTAHRSREERMDVLPDGRVYRITGSGSYTWTSLSGVSFDTHVERGLWLHWGWRGYYSGYRQPTESSNSGLCLISGLLRQGSNTYMGRTSGNCYPQQRLIFSSNNHQHIGRVDVRHDGYLIRSGGYMNHGWLSVDGMIYTRSGGNNMPLYNGWNHYHSGYRVARYHRHRNLCVLSGLIRGHWSSHITTLPHGCRPAARLIFGANVHNHNARVDVLPDGRVLYVNRHSGHGWLSLSGIHFVARR